MRSTRSIKRLWPLVAGNRQALPSGPDDGLRRLLACSREGRMERLDAGRDAFAAGTDRGFIRDTSKGNTLAAASAPNIVAEMTLPFFSARVLHVEGNDAFRRDAGRLDNGQRIADAVARLFLSRQPRTSDASRRSSVVRSGVTRPRRMDRPASMNSAASTTSTSPGVGINESVGSSAARAGSISM